VRPSLPRILAFALWAAFGLASWGEAQAPRPDALPPLTTIKSIRAMSQDEAARGYPVRVRAIVTHFDEQWDTGLIVHDGEFGQYVNTPAHPERVGEWKNLQRGDVIDIEGRTVRGGFAPNIEPARIRKVARAPLPAPKTIPFTSMLTGRHDCDYIEVNGVIQRAWFASDSSNHALRRRRVRGGRPPGDILGLQT